MDTESALVWDCVHQGQDLCALQSRGGQDACGPPVLYKSRPKRSSAVYHHDADGQWAVCPTGCLAHSLAACSLRLRFLWEIQGWAGWVDDFPTTAAAWRKWLCEHIEQFTLAYETNTTWMDEGLRMHWDWPCKCARSDCRQELDQGCVHVHACAHRFCSLDCGRQQHGDCAFCAAAFADLSAGSLVQVETDPAQHRPPLQDILWHQSKGIAREGVSLWDALLHIAAAKFADLKIPGRQFPGRHPVHVRIWRCFDAGEGVFLEYPAVRLDDWDPGKAAFQDTTPASDLHKETVRDLRTRIQPTARLCSSGKEPLLWDCVLYDSDYMVPADLCIRDSTVRLVRLYPPRGLVDDIAQDCNAEEWDAALAESMQAALKDANVTGGNSRLTVVEQHDLLDERLKELGHVAVRAMRDIDDNGDCLYLAVLAMLANEDVPHQYDTVADLRGAVADELAFHPYDPGQDEAERQQHAAEQRELGVWGDFSCVAALATILRRRICLVMSAPDVRPKATMWATRSMLMTFTDKCGAVPSAAI